MDDFTPNASVSTLAPPGGDDFMPTGKQLQWSDLPGNAIKEGRGILQGLGQVGKGILQYPSDVLKSGTMMYGGAPIENTPAVQDLGKVTGAIGSIPGNVWGDIKSLATHPINTMIQRPISTALNLSAIAAPFMAGEGEATGTLAKTGQAVEETGNQMATGAAGIAPEVMKKINYANPAQAGSDVGSRLLSEKALGSTPEETLMNMTNLENQYGKQVGDAIDSIRQQGQMTNPGAPDPLKADANPILQSTLDRGNQLGASPYSDVQSSAKPWKEMYNSLATKAYGKDGYLGLDDIRSEMQKVGQLFDAAKSDSAKYDLAGQLYGHLGQIRDQMVEGIAQQAKDPALAQNLRTANEGYSFYSRLLPSARNMAAMQGAGKTGIADAMSSRMGVLGGIASLAGGNVARGVGYLIGGRVAPAVMERMTPTIAKDIVGLGQGIQKYGPILQQAAVGGPRNLALVHALLLNDPAYGQALQAATKQAPMLSPMEAGHFATIMGGAGNQQQQ